MSRSLEQCDIRRGVAPPGLTLETLIVPLVTQNTGRGHHPPTLSSPTVTSNICEKLSQQAQISALTRCCSKLPSCHLNKSYPKGTVCNSLDSPHTPPTTVNGVKRLSIQVNQSEASLFAAKPTQSRIMKGSAGKGGKKQFC